MASVDLRPIGLDDRSSEWATRQGLENSRVVKRLGDQEMPSRDGKEDAKGGFLG